MGRHQTSLALCLLILFVLQTPLVKKLLPEAIPTLNLPQKSFQTETKPRREVVRLETDTDSASTSKQSSKVYHHLDEFKRKIAAVKLSGWSRKECEQHFVFEYVDTKHALPVYSVTADSGFLLQYLAGSCLITMNCTLNTNGPCSMLQFQRCAKPLNHFLSVLVWNKICPRFLLQL